MLQRRLGRPRGARAGRRRVRVGRGARGAPRAEHQRDVRALPGRSVSLSQRSIARFGRRDLGGEAVRARRRRNVVDDADYTQRLCETVEYHPPFSAFARAMLGLYFGLISAGLVYMVMFVSSLDEYSFAD